MALVVLEVVQPQALAEGGNGCCRFSVAVLANIVRPASANLREIESTAGAVPRVDPHTQKRWRDCAFQLGLSANRRVLPPQGSHWCSECISSGLCARLRSPEFFRRARSDARKTNRHA